MGRAATLNQALHGSDFHPSPSPISIVHTYIRNAKSEHRSSPSSLRLHHSQVTMSGTQRPGKEVTTSSQRKRVRSGGNVPPAPAVPRGQTRRFGVKGVVKEGKLWWKKHTETRYFSDMCIDRDSLAREFPQILRWIRELHMEFIFAKTGECNLNMVREFYAIKAPDTRSYFMNARGVDVTITPAVLNDIVGTSPDVDPLSMVQWTKHSGKTYHQSLPYAHMLREAYVWVKIVMPSLISGLHYTDITRESLFGLCLDDGHGVEHWGCLEIDDAEGPAPVDIMRTKGPDTEFGPTLFTVKRHRRDEHIMARMYGLDMLRHQNGCRASTDMQLGDVERRYPLNAHAKALLGIGSKFPEPDDDDIPTD
uniref:Uncharacterized protein n=1 Tax=Solanum tuberosum TaxID=4113 RepID=M1E0T2_SOLTU